MGNELTGKTFAAVFAAFLLSAAVAAAYQAWLPDVSVLRMDNPRTTKYVELYVRRVLSKGGHPAVSMVWVPLEGISPYLRYAVLIAEDDEMNRDMMKMALQKWGMRVVEAAHGEEVLTQLDANAEVDLVMMDLNMPGNELNHIFAHLIIRTITKSPKED